MDRLNMPRALFLLHPVVTYCADIEGAELRRLADSRFSITCLPGREGVNSTDVYSCENGVWLKRGVETDPQCRIIRGGQTPTPSKPTGWYGILYGMVYIVHSFHLCSILAGY